MERFSCKPDRRLPRRKPERQNAKRSWRGLYSEGLFLVTAELKAHRRKQLVGVVHRAARGKSSKQRAAQHRHWCALVDGGQDGPPAFARIRHATGKLRELWIVRQGNRGQVKDP